MNKFDVRLRGLVVAAAAALCCLAAPVTASASHPIQTSLGGMTACALLNDGSVNCWGQNEYGQLGNGTKTSSLAPVSVDGITTATQITSGNRFACALLSGGTVKCWGSNESGQLGDGTWTSSSTPVAVSGISSATQIAAGYESACALLGSGSIKCWGSGSHGDLGDGTGDSSGTPVSVSGITTATQVTFGFFHACAVLADTTVKCWGMNENGGALGGGTTDAGSSLPLTVVGLTGVSKVAAGYFHSCALMLTATVKCWGNNWGGSLGNPNTWLYAGVTDVLYVTDAVQLTSGAFNPCVRLTNGTVKCWGYNNDGQVGNGTTDVATTAVTVAGISDAIQISASVGDGGDGSGYVCVLRSNFAIKCWGDNRSGQLGDGSKTNRLSPVDFTGALLVTPEPPALSTLPDSPTRSTSASISITGAADASFSCSVDGASYSTCTSPVRLSGLADGSHSLKVKQTLNGRASSAVEATWNVDLTAPAAPQIDAAPAAVLKSRSGSVTFSSEPGATFTCSLDSGQFAPCSSPKSFSGLADGRHSLAVKATDRVGNVSIAAVSTWRVDMRLVAVSFTESPSWWLELGSGHWAINAPVTTHGDIRGAAEPMTIQVSTVKYPSQTIPRVAAHLTKVVAYAPSFVWHDSKRPLWIRVGTRAGKWTHWTALVRRADR